MRARILFLCLFFLPHALPAATLLVLGDSLSAAWGIEAEQGWVARLQERLNARHPGWTVINAAVSGDTTRTALNRLPPLLQRHRPAVVIVQLGGNDGLRGIPLEEMADNLAAIIRHARKGGARVLLVGVRLPPNYGPWYTRRFAQVYHRLAEEYGVPLVPRLLESVADDVRNMQDDGIHPRAEAQARMLDNVWPVLEPLLKQ